MDIKPILSTLLRHKLSTFLITLQIAITLAVVSNSVFLTADMMKGWNQESGIKEHDMLMVHPQSYDKDFDIASTIEADLRNLKNISDVVNVTPILSFPFAGGRERVFLESSEEAPAYITRIYEVNADGPEVLGLTLLAGRFFIEEEVVRGERSQLDQYSSVLLVSEDLSLELFPDGDGLGKTIWLEKQGRPVEIIGIYKNIISGETLIARDKTYHSAIIPLVAWEKNYDPNYLIRVKSGTAESVIETARRELYKVKGRYIYELHVLTKQRKRMYDGRGSSAIVLLTVSTVLIIINAFGIFGLVSFSVNQRKRQIGVRRVLGATKLDIIRYYLLENSLVTGFGLLLGIFISVLIAHLLSQLAEVKLFVWSYMALIMLFFLVVSLVAAWRPAVRAAAVDPAIITRG